MQITGVIQKYLHGGTKKLSRYVLMLISLKRTKMLTLFSAKFYRYLFQTHL